MKSVIVAIISLVLLGVAEGRCKSGPAESVQGLFEVKKIEKVSFNCSNSNETKEQIEVEQPGCLVYLELKKTKKGNVKEGSFQVYKTGELCKAIIGSLKELRLQTTGTECCDYVDGDISVKGICEGKATELEIRCTKAPIWKIVK